LYPRINSVILRKNRTILYEHFDGRWEAVMEGQNTFYQGKT
jgi:hypothetical protein